MITIPPVSMLDWLIFIATSVVLLLVLIAALKRIWQSPPKPAYQQKQLFGPERINALRLIDEAMAEQMRVFASVSLAEFIDLNSALNKSQREIAWQQLYGESVDFVLCSPQDLRVRVALVITDENLSKADQRKQQQLWDALQATGLPIIKLSAQALPSATNLRADILNACKAPAPVASTLAARSGQGRVEPIIRLGDDSELEQDEDDEPKIRIYAND